MTPHPVHALQPQAKTGKDHQRIEMAACTTVSGHVNRAEKNLDSTNLP